MAAKRFIRDSENIGARSGGSKREEPISTVRGGIWMASRSPTRV